MKKIGKLFLSTTLALCLALTGVLVACSTDEEKPEPGPVGGGETEITDGRWSNKKSEVFLKLNEDGTFYMAGMYVYDAGTYELKDGTFDYYKIESGATPDSSPDATDYPGTTVDEAKYTASQQLVLTAYDGTVYTAAYADGVLWNCLFPTPAGTMSRTVRQEADYAWDASKDEANKVEVVRVSLPKDANSTLILIHNKTFEDAVNGENGVWEKATDGGYTLKTSDGADYGTLTAVADGKCTLTLADDTAIELYQAAWTPVYTFNATEVSATIGGRSVTGDASLRLWENDDADLSITVQGDYSVETYDLLSGTYTQNSDGSFAITFAGMSAVNTTVPAADGTVSFTVTVPAGEVLDEAAEITLTGKVETAITTSYEFAVADVAVSGITGMDSVPTDLTLSLYSDNTAELKATLKVAAGMNYDTVVDTGTYSVDTSGMFPSITVVFEKAGEMKTSPDYASATASSVDLTLAYTAEALECTVSAMGSEMTMPLTFTASLRYTYSTAPAPEPEPVEVLRFATEENVTVSGIPGVNTAESPVVAVLYSDGSVELTVSVFDNEVLVDSGTYTIDKSGAFPAIGFEFDAAGTIAAQADFSTATESSLGYNITYTTDEVTVTALGNTFDISFTATLSGTYQKSA